MITLTKAPGCGRCEAAAETLDEIAIGHRVTTADESEGHLLVDGEEEVRGHPAIGERIEALKDLADHWYRYQSDACHFYGDEPPGDLKGCH